MSYVKSTGHLNSYPLGNEYIMKKKSQKDKKIRRFFNQQELNQIILKSIIKNENLSLVIKWNAISKLSNLLGDQNKTRFVNRCILTNRKAKFSKIFKKFSRLSFL